jgi:hypothetical protein
MMMRRYLPFIAVAGVLASVSIEAIGIAGRAERADPLLDGPVVVELFTSEGCSSCPPADAWLRELAAGGAVGSVAVIALSEHVDYWNRLGWKDPFSSAAMTARQGLYARALGAQVYTPQMVVDGEVEFIGSDQQAGTAAIRHAAASKKAAITAEVAIATPVIDVRATIAPGRLDRLPDADVFVAITEDGLVSSVAAGENQGRRLAHAAVARYFQKVERVKKGSPSASVSARIPIDPAWSLQKSRVVVLLQARDDARIVGAWSGPALPNGETRLERR